MTWTTVAALAATCLLMRIAVPLGLGERQPAWLERALTSAAPSLLAALIATGNGHPHADPRIAGVVAAVCAVALRAAPLLVILVAAGVTASLRAI